MYGFKTSNLTKRFNGVAMGINVPEEKMEEDNQQNNVVYNHQDPRQRIFGKGQNSGMNGYNKIKSLFGKNNEYEDSIYKQERVKNMLKSNKVESSIIDKSKMLRNTNSKQEVNKDINTILMGNKNVKNKMGMKLSLGKNINVNNILGKFNKPSLGKPSLNKLSLNKPNLGIKKVNINKTIAKNSINKILGVKTQSVKTQSVNMSRHNMFQKEILKNRNVNINNIAQKRIKQQIGLKPFGDYDGDGVKNALDCWPRNHLLQGPEHGDAIKNLIGVNKISAVDNNNNNVEISATEPSSLEQSSLERSVEDVDLTGKFDPNAFRKTLNVKVIDNTDDETSTDETSTDEEKDLGIEFVSELPGSKTEPVKTEPVKTEPVKTEIQSKDKNDNFKTKLKQAKELKELQLQYKLKGKELDLKQKPKQILAEGVARQRVKQLGTPAYERQLKQIGTYADMFKKGLGFKPLKSDVIGGFVGRKDVTTDLRTRYQLGSKIPLQQKVGLVRSRNVFSGDKSQMLQKQSMIGQTLQGQSLSQTDKIKSLIGGRQRDMILQQAVQQPVVSQPVIQPQPVPQVIQQPIISQPVSEQQPVIQKVEQQISREMTDLKQSQPVTQTPGQMLPGQIETDESGSEWVTTKDGKRIPRRNQEGKVWSHKSQRYVTYTREKYDKDGKFMY